MGVGLYTSRVVLNTLGIEDFGVYNIVGGVVVLFGFFNSAMSSATQRFLSFDIGKNNAVQLNKTFNTTLNIHFFIAIIVLVLAETIGLWFVNYKLNLPNERMSAVNWIYQFSILTFLLGIIQVPYNALIIARERMNVYAYISIFEVVFKLLIVYFLVVLDYDKLKLYAVLLFAIAFLVRLIEKEYCKRNFEESKYSFYYDKEYTKVLLTFSGWSLFGNIAAIARLQGNNILLNLFFGTILNASYGIAMQVQGVVSTFVSNFQMAVNPQIIIQYATGNKEQSLDLIYQSAKLSFFIMFIISCPIIFSVDYVLEFWLRNPPKFSSVFVILSLVIILIDTISNPLIIGAQANGNIKWYQITIGTLILTCLPISYVLLKIYNDPKFVFIAIIVLNILSLGLRMLFLQHLIGFKINYFFKTVLLKIFYVVLLFATLYYLLIDSLTADSDFSLFLLKSVCMTIGNIFIVFYIGLNKRERSYLISLIKEIL
jgi:O-antigen/teichoic acid export membrane protein